MSTPPVSGSAVSPRAPGVWETDAPTGYIALVMYDAAGAMVLRLEIRESAYSPEMLPPLEEWVRQYDAKPRLRAI